MSNVQLQQLKNDAELSAEWDTLAQTRHEQLAAGIDLSFNYVIAPAALRLLDGADLRHVFDIGSGTGHFSCLLSPLAETVVGIDPSAASIHIAETLCADLPNVRFRQCRMEAAHRYFSARSATAAVAVMVLMTVPKLDAFVAALAELLKPCGRFVAIIPHPFYWPKYRGYAEEPWFDYLKESFIEAPFFISQSRTDFKTTHIHRPISLYLNTFAEHGFALDRMEELMPEPGIQALYPEPWKYPRFVALQLTLK